jgi:hypothetical protein
LKAYSSYNPILSLLVTTPLNYNKLVTNQKFYPEDWDTICKSGGVGPKKAQGFKEDSTTYFSRDMYIDSCIVNSIVGINQENRGSNSTDLDITIIEPYGMDFIEQLYDYCTIALGESNYCQLPYMLKIEFKGYKDDGTNETVPNATKYIPIHLLTMEIKVNNLGAVYKVKALAFNDIGNTEQYGRIPATIQLGTGGLVSELTYTFTEILKSIQTALQFEKIIEIPDVYTVTFSTVADENGSINIGKCSFSDTKNTPTVAKDNQMGKPVTTQEKQLSIPTAAQNYLKYAIDSFGNAIDSSGNTTNGATINTDAHLITFNSGSSIIDCLNSLIINSDYIVSQIKHYNGLLDQINKIVTSSSVQANTPDDLQKLIAELNTPLNWFRIVPTVTFGKYDSTQTRNIYSRNINYDIQPYKIYNTRSISAPNGNPIADNRVVKEYDYIFSGKNTEILSFDLIFNNAFITYAQFNHDTKIQGTGAGMPSDTQISTLQPGLKTPLTPITCAQSKLLVSSSDKSSQGVGAITPERNQASDIVSTVYSKGDQIQLDLSIYGDPDYIRQDGVFINVTNSDAFVLPSGKSQFNGINYSSGEVYANVNFKVPQDINLNTGTLDLAFEGDAINYRRNVYSGQYRVIEVTNKFDKALFTQQLTLFRYDDSHSH